MRGTLAVSWPASTVTLAGTVATVGMALARLTMVLTVGALLKVTVSEPLAPCVVTSNEGNKLAIRGGAGVTLTVALAVLPFNVALMVVLP